MRNLFITLILALSLALAACDFKGGVEQGRCVAFSEADKTVTLVVDTTHDQHDPHYSGKVDTWKMPTNPLDVGPLPEPGGLLMLEIDKKMALYYDRETNSLKEQPVEEFKVEKMNEKSPKLKGRTFPEIDKANKTIAVYSPRLEALVTCVLPEDAFDVPEDVLKYRWTLGNEVRIAFRTDQGDQAIRFMNVTKTSIFTR